MTTSAPGVRARRHRPRRLGSLAQVLLVTVACVAAVLPVWWMFNVVFAPAGSALALSPRLWPSSWSAGVDNIARVMQDGVFHRALLNSFVYSTVQALGTLALTSLAAYEFAHGTFAGRRWLFGLAIIGLMVPTGVTVLPTQRIVAQLHWLNTLQGVTVALMASAFSLFLLTEYMRAVPKELLEAARVDGLGRFGIYWRIALPLSSNGLLAVGILVFIIGWSNYLWPLIVVTQPARYPVSVAAASYFAPQSIQTTSTIMAAALISVAPLIVVYVALQRWIVESIARVGVRG